MPRAELNGLLELAKDGRIACVVDCEYVVKGYRLGHGAIHNIHVDMWCQLWRALQERSVVFRIRQVHLHPTAEELTHGHVDPYDYITTELAIEAANLGAALYQPRASIHNVIAKIDAKAWLIQARLVAVDVAANEACSEEPRQGEEGAQSCSAAESGR